MSYDEAVQSSLGLSLDQLDAEWKAWLDYPGDAPPEQPSAPDDDALDLGTREGQVFVGVALGVIACLVVAGIAAFVLAYRSHRAAQSGG
jgi:hypothetical protein